MQYSYVINGSEDGNVAVTSKKGRALDMARAYMRNACEYLGHDATKIETEDNIFHGRMAWLTHPDMTVSVTVEKFEIE